VCRAGSAHPEREGDRPGGTLIDDIDTDILMSFCLGLPSAMGLMPFANTAVPCQPEEPRTVLPVPSVNCLWAKAVCVAAGVRASVTDTSTEREEFAQGFLRRFYALNSVKIGNSEVHREGNLQSFLPITLGRRTIEIKGLIGFVS